MQRLDYHHIFSSLTGHARTWIYGFEKTLSVEQRKLVHERLSSFMNQWATHGESVRGDFLIAYDRFVIIAAETDLSGCSIDSSTHLFKDLKEYENLNALNRNLIFYWKNQTIRFLKRNHLYELFAKNAINVHTIVFDLTIQTVDQLRQKKFETPLSQTWVAQLLAS